VRSLRGQSSAPDPIPVATPPSATPPHVLPEFRLDGGGSLDSLPASSIDAEPSKELAVEPTADSSDTSKREGSARGARTTAAPAPAPAPKEAQEGLHAAQQLLHAQRYDEARLAFGKLLAGRQSRGGAAAGLAQIAFQEKKYKEAVERAKESARFGGGAEARVLLGDAYFKLERFDEAKKAYTDALKLDPNNRVAGQGLRLVEGQ
jgi:tetratricopeptide (TPR) repeat protein